MRQDLIDAYQVMKIAGELIDELHNVPLSHEDHVKYWDLSNLWWDAATIYVPEVNRLNKLLNESH